METEPSQKGITRVTLSMRFEAWAASRHPLKFRQALLIAVLSNGLGLAAGVILAVFDSLWGQLPPDAGALGIIDVLMFAVLAAGAFAPATAVCVGSRTRHMDGSTPWLCFLSFVLATTSVLLGEVICAVALSALVLAYGIATGDREGGSVVIVLMIGLLLAVAVIPGGVSCALGVLLGRAVFHPSLVPAGDAPKSKGAAPNLIAVLAKRWRWGLLAVAVLQIIALLQIGRLFPPTSQSHDAGAASFLATLAIWSFLLGNSWACVTSVGVSLLAEPDASAGRRAVRAVPWALVVVLLLWGMHVWNARWWM